MTSKITLLVIAVIGIVLAVIPVNVYAIDTEEEKVARRERFYAAHPEFPKPDDLSTEGYEKRAKEGSDDSSSRLENPDEVQPQYGGPRGDPFCKVVRSFANSPLGPVLDNTGKGFDPYEKRCGDLDGENVAEDTITTLKSIKDSQHTPIEIKSDVTVGLDMIDCVKKDSYGSLSSDEKDRCDDLMLQVQEKCDKDPDMIYCPRPGELHPLKVYLSNHDLNNEDKEEEDEED